MEHLFDKLKKYSESDIYPYHMPGHKRQAWGELPGELYRSDITEIDGFDNLHQPEGILGELQRRATMLYGAEESFYLVNGSTSGILSAVSAAVPFGGHILMARNCHKSAYHALYLRNLTVSYLYPPVLQEYDIYDAVTPEQVEQALEQNPGVQAVLIVSPTYEGRIADVKAIAELVHKKGIPLIVDEAHGAHLGFADGFAPNSCVCGADLVIHSVHKTLPALTQTALLHVGGRLIDREKLKRFLHIYQSSSPSYLLMASIDNALWYVEKKGRECFKQFVYHYHKMQTELSECRHLKFLSGDCRTQDVGKLFISVKGSGMTGKQLYDILLKQYHLQPEMASESYVLAMFTVNDSEEAYHRMTEALIELDGKLEAVTRREPEHQDVLEPKNGEPDRQGALNPKGVDSCTVNCREAIQLKVLTQDKSFMQLKTDATVSVLPLHLAWEQPGESVPLDAAVGRYAAEFVNLYPPGVPILVPGEVVTEEICRRISEAEKQGLTIQGIEYLSLA